MKPKLFNSRLLASLCHLNYLQICVKGKWLNSEKRILIDLLQSSFCYVPNFTILKYSSKISIIISHQIKISKRYNEQVFNKKGCSYKFRNIHREAHASEFFLNKNAGLQSWNFIKKRFQHRFFPVNIAKFLRTPIFENICKRLFERFPT